MKLGLGTAQLGLPYGVTNRRGRPSRAEALRLLKFAGVHGVDLLDTAPAYGEAERIIGEALADGGRFRVITKTVAGASGPAELRAGFLRSLAELRVDRADGLLLHHAGDALAPGGRALLDAMRALKDEGRAARIGVSVYDAVELDALLALFTPDIVQLPLSAFDQRLARSGHLAKLAALGVEIHARSVFLQGTLLAAPESLPERLAPLRGRIAGFQAALHEAGCRVLEGALAFVARCSEVSYAIVGAATVDEFADIAAAAARARDPGVLSARLDFGRFAIEDENLVNPARWPRAATGAT